MKLSINLSEVVSLCHYEKRVLDSTHYESIWYRNLYSLFAFCCQDDCDRAVCREEGGSGEWMTNFVCGQISRRRISCVG